MRQAYRLFIIILMAFVALSASSIHAQSVQETIRALNHPVYGEITAAMEQGELSESEAILEKFYLAYDPDQLSDRFSHSDTPAPVKCLVPLLQEFRSAEQRLPASTIREIEEMTAMPESTTYEEYLSPSGNFRFFYETEGVNGVPLDDTNNSGIPDYVEAAAFAADSSYRYQVEEAGFREFLRSQPYEIYFQNLNFYGATFESGSTTFIRVHNNFLGFPPNTHPEGDQIGALYVTIAHEIKHAIQFATNRWQGQAGSFNWIEMDATLMEEVVFPDVNDYYNYIREDFDSVNPNFQSIFGRPGNPTPGAYWHVTWMIYFYEQYGIEFWVDVWDQLVEDRTRPFFTAIQNSLDREGLRLELEHINSHMWHMSSGPDYSGSDFGFSDRENYPTPSFSGQTFNALPDSITNFSLRSFAATYYRATPQGTGLGQPLIKLNSEQPGVAIGVVGHFRDGTTDQQIVLNPGSNSQSLQTTWDWSDLTEITIAVVNTNRDGMSDYTLKLDSAAAEEDLIAQNYPNPFRNQTRIEYSISEPSNVRIDLYDSIGRRVATLVDERKEAGFHNVEFDGRGFASGVYHYRIITDRTALSKKMLLIR
ncbi:MAG: T9SS type A sorting domain-containing protein [Balneolaceae bacterium]|nr:T9SS type A sorting domain-containing protein [Balneolaceae bacterium]MCH8548116.1 T9SS type A sorting domain-containing protein [Balneolaceae bacterium]